MKCETYSFIFTVANVTSKARAPFTTTTAIQPDRSAASSVSNLNIEKGELNLNRVTYLKTPQQMLKAQKP